jgi:hypothetical protein
VMGDTFTEHCKVAKVLLKFAILLDFIKKSCKRGMLSGRSFVSVRASARAMPLKFTLLTIAFRA